MGHKCHWPGCGLEVPPKLWGCREHWFRLPKPLRDQIWKEYRPGQEIDKNPSARYVATAILVQGWIAGKVVFGENGSVRITEDIPIDRLVTKIMENSE